MSYRHIDQKPMKKDAMQLLLGKPAYTEDVTPADCLVVKVLRSPYAHALIKNIDTTIACKVPGIEAVYTYKDVPQNRFTMAGQTYPEFSPYDKLILDQRLRFVGDAVAIVAGENEKAVDKALKLIKTDYEVLEPVLDMHTAMDHPVLVHPEDNWDAKVECGADNKRNLVASSRWSEGDVEDVLNNCDKVIRRTYHTQPCQQAAMETFRTYCEIDYYGRLHVISSTQIVFHARRIIANALNIPKSMVRVEKPRIGGGFGSKQTLVAEIYPAFVTWLTKKPSRIVYSRKEVQTCGTPRHEMEMTVTIGAMNDGTIRCIDLYTLSNTGAYSEHGPTTVGLSGTKSIPLYTANLEAFRFDYDVVYTNVQSSGAYRGYGATQGIYAVESAVSEMASVLGIDPVTIREKNMVREGMEMPAYYHEIATSCNLDKCMEKAKNLFDWENKSKVRVLPNGHIRSAGVAMAMQGSGISGCDVGSATVKLEETGFYTLTIGAADMGTGCDTTLAQIAAETLECDLDMINVFGADTDISPYDSGSYASSTTYVTGKAVQMAAEDLIENMKQIVSQMKKVPADDMDFIGTGIKILSTGETVSLEDIATKSMFFNNIPVQITRTNTQPFSPPPFMVGMAETDIDPLTGKVEVVDYVAVVDCGTPINHNLATVQTEGGIVQGIGMALTETVTYTDKGQIMENSFMQYKIPARTDIGSLRIDFAGSYEPTGPYGAKSIGEIVINTPSPAINAAVASAIGKFHYTLPIRPESVLDALEEKK
ncbi:MAG: molybdopterin-dependent oxidoreductase [Erysipelotrichaceae bacterium]|nr:molybdopterin-dependent oxidoreductase [Erysipelotrichaceae bacterium]